MIELGSTTTIKQAVMDGAGLAILGEVAVTAELREGRLRRVSVVGIDLKRTFRAVWRAQTSLHPASLRLLQTS